MASLAVKVRVPARRERKIVVELNAVQFERLAANFGFYNPDFLESAGRAEREISQGKARRLRSLRSLRYP